MTLKLEVGKKYVKSNGDICVLLITGMDEPNPLGIYVEKTDTLTRTNVDQISEYKEPVIRWLWTWPFSCKVTAYLFSEDEVRKTNWKIDWNEDEAPSIKLEWSKTEFPE